MRKIRNLTMLAGLCLVLATLGAPRAKAQVLSTVSFTGTVTLPHQVQWGQMTLPAGDYVVQYGRGGPGGLQMVEITGKAKGSPHGVARVVSTRRTQAGENALSCIRDGSTLIARALEIPQIGQMVEFKVPGRTRLLARELNSGKKVQIAERQKAIQRIPVKTGQQ